MSRKREKVARIPFLPFGGIGSYVPDGTIPRDVESEILSREILTLDRWERVQRNSPQSSFSLLTILKKKDSENIKSE